jgi:quinol monooxygenase YgiN
MGLRMTYTVIVKIEAMPGKEQALKDALMAVMRPTQEEIGCVEYRLHQQIDNPAKFIFYENWQNKAAHILHSATPHLKALAEKIPLLVDKPMEVIFAEEIK